MPGIPTLAAHHDIARAAAIGRAVAAHRNLNYACGGSVVSSCTCSSQGVVARPVSNLVSIGVPVPSVADTCGAPVLRDKDRSAGLDKADTGVEGTAGYLLRPMVSTWPATKLQECRMWLEWRERRHRRRLACHCLQITQADVVDLPCNEDPARI